MSFHNWLQSLRNTFVLERGKRHTSSIRHAPRDARGVQHAKIDCHMYQRRGSVAAAACRLNLEALDDRCLPSFSPAVSYDVGANPQAMATGHFNEDDFLDLVTANYADGTVSVLLGNGDGTFQPAVTSDAGTNPLSIAVGDFNADDKLDLAELHGYDFGYSLASSVSVMLGNGDGSFQAPNTVNLDPGSKPTSVATGDFNEDGMMDLAVTSSVDTYYPYDVYPDAGQASVLLAIGDGSFSAPRTLPIFNAADSVVVADFNGDDNLDLVAGSLSWDGGIVQVILGDGDGNIALANDSNWLFRHGASMKAGDLNGDGNTDLVSANGFDVTVRMGNGVGGFVAPPGGQHYVAGDTPTSAVLGDFNRDGVLDIATANSGSNDISILRGKGDGTFWNPENFAAGPGAYAVAAGDFNRDGWLDVATANAGGNSASVLINDQSWGPVPPLVSVSDATAVTEGNAGTVNATFTLTLLFATNVDVTVHYNTADITAAAGSDYTSGSGDVVIPAGQTSGTFTVAVLGDRLAEPTETFAVNLAAATNATIGDGQGIGTILDNEPRITINNVAKKEGGNGKRTVFTFTVRLSAPTDQVVTVNYATADGTATAGSDYESKTGTVTFAPGQTTQTITVVVNGDRLNEANENFFVDLSGESSNALISDPRGVGTILDDDRP